MSDASLPNLFVVGAPKSGTTSLYHSLAAHPEIYMSRIKEPLFLPLDVSPHRKFLDSQNYESLFSGMHQFRYRGEAQTWNLYSRVAAERITELFPNSKILLVLRSPVDLIKSLFLYNRCWLIEDQERLEDALALEGRRARGLSIPSRCTLHERLQYTSVVTFNRQVRRYLGKFSRDQLFILVYEHYKREPQKAMVAIQEFLGLENGLEVPAQKNVTQSFRNKTLQEWSLYTAPRLKEGRGPVVRTISGALQKVVRRINAVPASPPVIGTEAAQKLAQIAKNQAVVLPGADFGNYECWV